MSNCGSNSFEIGPSSSTAVAPTSLSDQPAAAAGRQEVGLVVNELDQNLVEPKRLRDRLADGAEHSSVEIVWGSWEETCSSCSRPGLVAAA